MADRKDIKLAARKGLGIKGRLMLSFGLVALTTVLAGGIGIFSYNSIQSTSLKVTRESVPAMTNAFRMVAQATALRTLASTLAGVSDQAEYAAATDQFTAHREEMDQVLKAIAVTSMPEAKIEAIESLKSDLFNALQDLTNRVGQRLDAADRRELAATAITENHRRLTDWLAPQIDDASFNVVVETEDSTKKLSSQIKTLMTDGVDRLQSALTLRAEVNLMAGILIEAAVAPDQGTLEATADRFQAARATVDEHLAKLVKKDDLADLTQSIHALEVLGTGPEGIFEARRTFFSRNAGTQRVAPIFWAHRVYEPREKILRALEPIVDNASFDLVILSDEAVSENSKTINQLIDHSVGNLQGLLGIAADTNWLAGLLRQVSMERDEAALEPIIEQINAALNHLDTYKALLHIPETAQKELDGFLQPLIDRATGSESVVILRKAELDILNKQKNAVKLTENLAARLTQAVNEVVEFAHVDVRESSDAVQEAIANGRLLLIALSLASLFIAAAVVYLYVGPKIVTPLGKISDSVGRLARGEDVTVPGTDRGDELGLLARSLGVIYDQAIEATRIKLALDSADSPVMVTDAEHKVIYVNERLEQMFAMAETDLRFTVPEFAAGDLVGGTLDFVYRLRSQFKTAIERLEAPHHESLAVGARYLSFVASPVMASNGSRLGTVLQWQDETEERQLRQAIGSVVKAARAGDFTKRVETDGIKGTMAELANGINDLASVVDGATADLGQMLASLAQGDLTRRIHNQYEGALGELKDNANRTADQLGNIVARIQAATSEVANAAGEISGGTSDLSIRTERAAANLEETAASTTQMAETVNQNADNAKNASALAATANEAAETGGGIVKQAVDAMTDIEGSAEKISNIISVIDEIAFQTNLLALNASVEAARSGEAGRGFAVVAQEVRQLAQRSAQAASEIKALIHSSNAQVSDGARLVNQTGEALGEIVEAIKKVSSIVSDIASASQEQATGVQEINQSISSMDDMTQQNSRLVEESTAAARALEKQTGTLTELIAYFKVDDVALSDKPEQQPYQPTIELVAMADDHAMQM